MRRKAPLIIFALMAALWGIQPLRAAQSIELQVLPASEVLLNQNPGGALAAPEAGTVLIAGRMRGRSFAITSISQVTVVNAANDMIPLYIEETAGGDDLLEDDEVDATSELTSIRFYFLVPEASLAGAKFTLRWGEDVKAPNHGVSQFRLDPQSPERYRELRLPALPEDDGGGMKAELEVQAVSDAELYFLWYLLPMAVIFAVLSIRKFHARHSEP
jgi:hypothetical protein